MYPTSPEYQALGLDVGVIDPITSRRKGYSLQYTFLNTGVHDEHGRAKSPVVK